MYGDLRKSLKNWHQTHKRKAPQMGKNKQNGRKKHQTIQQAEKTIKDHPWVLHGPIVMIQPCLNCSFFLVTTVFSLKDRPGAVVKVAPLSQKVGFDAASLHAWEKLASVTPSQDPLKRELPALGLSFIFLLQV